jgi:hypothetical protein
VNNTSYGDPPVKLVIDSYNYADASVPKYYQRPSVPEPIYIIAPKNWGAETVMKYEGAMRIHMNRNDIYVFPYGTELSCMKKNDDAVAVVKCSHCGQWSARYTCCKACGAPVE